MLLPSDEYCSQQLLSSSPAPVLSDASCCATSCSVSLTGALAHGSTGSSLAPNASAEQGVGGVGIANAASTLREGWGGDVSRGTGFLPGTHVAPAAGARCGTRHASSHGNGADSSRHINFGTVFQPFSKNPSQTLVLLVGAVLFSSFSARNPLLEPSEFWLCTYQKPSSPRAIHFSGHSTCRHAGLALTWPWRR